MSRVERAVDAVEARRSRAMGGAPTVTVTDPSRVRLMLDGLDVDAEEALAAADDAVQRMLNRPFPADISSDALLTSVWFFGFVAGRLYGEVPAGEDL